ncbi:hypothetical protein K474DRAFT_1772062 [Panus rudis PR-1116 ss-1]|nr:hypothetical protein K474DRAFT_1772062 [Panus rudis PR-1116 ss-1]
MHNNVLLPLSGEGDGVPGTGHLGGPPIQHNFKRAVMRPPPRVFTVQVLPAMKLGSSFAYGLLITPIQRVHDDSSSTSGSSSGSSRRTSTISEKASKSGSGSSSKSATEYEVWRRWEDCLWFQDLLEAEYESMAYEKRRRLAQGKGVKKGEMYQHGEQAASFESLPPGPEASSIAKDVHEIIPKLSRKGTLFKPSQATIDQRAKEFKAMIEALFQEDVPTLIKELRNSRVIRDFFGYWRRDQDHEEKAAKEAKRANSPRSSRSSIASSAFSMYFSASNISLQLPTSYPDLPPSPSPVSPPRRSRTSDPEVRSTTSVVPSSAPANLTFTVDQNGSLTPASPIMDNHSRSSAHHRSLPGRARASSVGAAMGGSGGAYAPSIPEDVSLDDVMWRDSVIVGRLSGGLEALPEGQELVPHMSNLSMGSEDILPPARRQRSASTPDRTSHRQGLVFTPTAQGPVVVDPDGVLTVNGIQPDGIPSQEMMPKSPTSYTDSSAHSSMALTGFSDQASWRTSMSSMMSLPSISDVSEGFRKPQRNVRESVVTMNSMMTDSSVDAVLPRRFMSPSTSSLKRSSSTGSSRRNTPTAAVPNEEVWDEQRDELLDSYFYDPGLRSTSVNTTRPSFDDIESSQIPGTPGRERTSNNVTQIISTPERYPKPFQNRPPGQFHIPWSPTASTAPSTSSSPRGSTFMDTFTIKAVLREDTAVLLKAAQTMSLATLRERIRDKFLSQENVTLTEGFVVAIVTNPAAAAKPPPRGRPRSNSTSAVGVLNTSGLRYITAEQEWQELASNCVGKLTLRIINGF